MTLAFLASTSFSFKPHFIVLTCTHSKIATFIYLDTYMINGHYQVFTCTTPTCIVYGCHNYSIGHFVLLIKKNIFAMKF